jgi:hypothetical protein
MRALQFMFFWVCTLCVYSLTSLGILGVWAWNNPAFPAEAECIITKDQYTKALAATGQEELPFDAAKMKAVVGQLVKRTQNNGFDSVKADSFSVFGFSREQQIVRLVYWDKGCYVHDGLLSVANFVRLLQSAEGPDI